MLIYDLRENDGVDLILYFASIEAYPIVRRLEKIMVKQVQAKREKKKKDVGSLGSPFGHLSVNSSVLSFPKFVNLT